MRSWSSSALLALLCASGIGFLTVLALRLMPEPQPQSDGSASRQKNNGWQDLRVAVAAEPVQRYSELVPGTVVVDERKAARVSSPLAGRVERVHVELGQPVKRGDALLTISSLDLPTLRSALEQANSELALAVKEDARVQSMVRQQLLPAKEALSATARLRQAELAQRAAAGRIRAMRLHSAREHSFVLRAEMNGTIVEKSVFGSQSVRPAEGLLQIADLESGLFVNADVFESELGAVKIGAPARIFTRVAGRQALDSHVDMISSVVDPVRHTVLVRMHVKASHLRVNERVDVSLWRSAPQGATEVSSTAVLSDGDHHRVYVLDAAGKFQRRAVLPGWKDAGRVVILAGLSPGERVLEHGGQLIESQRIGLF